MTRASSIRFAIHCPYIIPLISVIGMESRTPYRIVWPRSAPNSCAAAAGAGCYHRFMTWWEDLILAVAGTLGMVGFVAQMIWMVELVRGSFGL